MRVLCIKDGVNDFGTNCEPVKKDKIYTVTGTTDCPPHLNLRGIWYELKELPGYIHYGGLFAVISEKLTDKKIHMPYETI